MDWLSGLDFDPLLEPISEENPCGPDLRDDDSHNSIYFKIKSLRHEARALERKRVRGETDCPPPETCWKALVNLLTDTLANKSKDLELCAYLIESLIRQHDFPGLRDGFRVTRELCERYWEGIYPLPDESGLETRTVYLAGLNGVESDGTLIGPILMCPLTAGATVSPCSTAGYQQSQQLSSLPPDQQRQYIEEGALSPDMVATAVKETPIDFLTQQREHIAACLEEFALLTSCLDERCADQAPHSSSIRTALETCAETLLYVAGNTLAEAEPVEEASADADVADDGTQQAPSRPAPRRIDSSQIQSRTDALKCMQLVADYFRRTEPHSPLSYAADQLVRWGGMSLPELLVETLPDPSARSHLFTLMGMPESHAPEYD